MSFRFFLLIVFLGGACFLGATELELIDERLKKQKAAKVGNCCSVPWKDRWCTADILAIQGSQMTVRVCDDALPVEEWPSVVFELEEAREFMVGKYESLDELIEGLKVNCTLDSPQIEQALRLVDRAYFAPSYPYFDVAIDIGCGMCISTPHMHVRYLELVKDQFETATAILDVGTGTGVLAAMLAELAPHAKVIGIEYYEDLVKLAEKNCSDHLPKSLTSRLHWIAGNGLEGRPEEGPYDIIVVGFMCKDIPHALLEQIKPGGTMIIPIGSRVSGYDDRLRAGPLYQIKKGLDSSYHIYRIHGCSFVPSQAD